MIVNIPNLDEKLSDYAWLFKTAQYVQPETNVIFNFSGCMFLGPSAVAFLGGLARLLIARGCVVEFRWHTLPMRVKNNLIQNGFLHAFGQPHAPRSGNSIPYREDPVRNPKPYVAYLEQMWLGKKWIKISEALCSEIISRLCEGYLNVFDHSQSPVGLICCGQHFPKKHLLRLTMIDFGVGIPENVRNHFHKTKNISPQSLPADTCLKWAFQRGTSTLPGGRGLGLDLLSSFVRVNNGHMEIFSNEGYARADNSGLAFTNQEVYFAGTLVTILLRCDEKSYCLATEQDPVF